MKEPQRGFVSSLLLLGVIALLILVALAYHFAGSGQPSADSAAVTALPSQEMINVIPVPPEPDKTLNDSTLAGIDSNNNGVRDDVERLVAKGTSNADGFATAMTIARGYQTLLMNKQMNQKEWESITLKIACSDYKNSQNNQSITATEIGKATMNTDARMKAYQSNPNHLGGMAIDILHDCN